MSASAIDALAQALDDERSALLANDGEALMRANEAKLAALHSISEQLPTAASHEQLAALMRRNQANGALLARRQREVRWALRHLGRLDAANDYRADGRLAGRVYGRALGVG